MFTPTLHRLTGSPASPFSTSSDCSKRRRSENPPKNPHPKVGGHRDLKTRKRRHGSTREGPWDRPGATWAAKGMLLWALRSFRGDRIHLNSREVRQLRCSKSVATEDLKKADMKSCLASKSELVAATLKIEERLAKQVSNSFWGLKRAGSLSVITEGQNSWRPLRHIHPRSVSTHALRSCKPSGIGHELGPHLSDIDRTESNEAVPKVDPATPTGHFAMGAHRKKKETNSTVLFKGRSEHLTTKEVWR